MLFCLTTSGFYKEKLEIEIGATGIRNLSAPNPPMTSLPMATVLIVMSKQYQIIETHSLSVQKACWLFKLAVFLKD